MVFKRGVAMLALAAAASVATAEARDVLIDTSYEHPVVKDVKTVKGGVEIVLAEGAQVSKKKEEAHHHKKSGPKPEEHKKGVQHFPKGHKKEEAKKKKKTAPKAVEHKKGIQHFPKDHKKEEARKKKSVPGPAKHEKVVHHQKEPKAVEHKKGIQHFKKEEAHKKEHKKEAAHKKQVSQEKKPDGEIIKKYKHGQVRIKANNQPAAESHHKKASRKESHKKIVHKKQVDDSLGEGYEEADVDLESGETVTLTFGEHEVELTLLKNGSLVLVADDETTVLPPAESVDLDIEVDDTDESAVGSGSSSSVEVVGGDEQDAEATEGEIAMVARKFAEFATKVTGDGKYISKEAAPIVFVAGVVGALAAVVGIAAYAVGRARDRAADPQSVLSDVAATEDVEAAATKEETADADADDSESLASSDSEDETIEEGKFTNEVASV